MNRITKLAVGIIALAFVVVGGTYALTQNSDPYAGWETYRNEELGYSVKYPEEYELEQLITEPKEILGIEFLDEVAIKIPNSTNEISIEVIRNKGGVTKEEWAESNAQAAMWHEPYRETRIIEIGGVEAIEYVAYSEDFFVSSVVLNKDDFITYFTVSVDKGDKKFWNTYDLFLNSLTFDGLKPTKLSKELIPERNIVKNPPPIKTIDEITGWQTYRNDELGFSVEYPEGFIVVSKPNGLRARNERIEYLIFNEPFVTTRLVSLNISRNSENLSLEEWINEKTAFGKIGSAPEVESRGLSINGVPAKEFRIIINDSDFGSDIILKKSDIVFRINTSVRDNLDKEIYTHFLETFKFD